MLTAQPREPGEQPRMGGGRVGGEILPDASGDYVCQ